MSRELIKNIYLEAPDKSSGKCRQKIYIEFDFITLEELVKMYNLYNLLQTIDFDELFLPTDERL